LLKDSLEVAIEGLSWMAYGGLGERAALFKAAQQLEANDTNDLRQAYRLIMETTRFQNRLDNLISQVVPGDRMERAPHGVRSFFRIIAYLRYVGGMRRKELERHVELARQILGWKELREYENQMARIVAGRPISRDSFSESDKISLDTCHPVWFVRRLVNVFGRSFALRVLRRDLLPLPGYARLNPLRADSQVSEQLQGIGVEGVEGVFRLDAKRHASRLIKSGGAVMQDLASITAGLVASPKPGQTVLDVCAAPGNKTTHAAAQMQNRGKIYSIDLSQRRFAYWMKEVERCGCEIAAPILADARRVPMKIGVDVAIVDPPCSNSGVFAKNPAGKWRISPARVSEHAIRQSAILQAVSAHVKPEGTLIYCTCSILPEEDEYVIEDFLRRQPSFKLVPQNPFLGVQGLRGFNLCQRFFPHLHECNGYFIAKLQRGD
jgi:16S rRNA C967 or C1407 C5-methylase (RsmB/RsmF family)